MVIYRLQGLSNMQPLGIDIRDEGNTFWQDFTIADVFGGNAIKRTYDFAFKDFSDDAEMFAKFTIVLNHKGWQWAEQNIEISKFYFKLWEQAHGYALRHFKGDDISTYLQITD